MPVRLSKSLFTPEQRQNLSSLGAAVGAIGGGLVGNSLYNAAVGSQVGQNAVVNNEIKIIRIIKEASQYQPCYVCDELKAPRLKTQEFFRSDTGKGLKSVWYTTQGVVETTAIFIPQLRAVSTTMTIAGATYKVVIYGDFSGEASYAVSEAVGRAAATSMPYDPSKWPSRNDYDMGIELLKFATGKAVDALGN